MKHTVASTIGPMTVGAMIAIAGLVGGMAWADERTGTITRYEQLLPAPNADAPQMVMIVTATATPTERGYRSLSPTATSTPDPILVILTPHDWKPTPTATHISWTPCIEGIATPGERCKQMKPTATLAVPTRVPTYPGKTEAKDGDIYIWPRD